MLKQLSGYIPRHVYGGVKTHIPVSQLFPGTRLGKGNTIHRKSRANEFIVMRQAYELMLRNQHSAQDEILCMIADRSATTAQQARDRANAA